MTLAIYFLAAENFYSFEPLQNYLNSDPIWSYDIDGSVNFGSKKSSPARELITKCFFYRHSELLNCFCWKRQINVINKKQNLDLKI